MAAPRTAAEWDAFFSSALPGGSGSGTARPVFSDLGSGTSTAFASATGRSNLRLYDSLYSGGPSPQPQRFTGKKYESAATTQARLTKERLAKLSPDDDTSFSLSGLFKNAAGDVVDLVTGVPGMIELGGKAVLGLGGTIASGGNNETAKRWLTESAGLLKDGVVESGKQWGQVGLALGTFGQKGSLRPAYEDPAFMLLDVAAAATLGAGAGVKGAAVANKAARNAAQKQRGTRANPNDPLEPFIKKIDDKGNVNNPLAAILDFSRSADKGQRKRDNWDAAEALGERARRTPRPSARSGKPGKVKAGPLAAQRLLRQEYLKGRDLKADPLSAAERVSLATNWARLNPTARTSVMRLGPVVALSNEQRAIRAFGKDGNPVERKGYDVLDEDSGKPKDIELDDLELTGFRRSRGVIRRGIQNKFDDFVLGPKAAWGRKRSLKNYEENTRRSFLTKALDPTQRQINRSTKRGIREAQDAVNSALVRAGGMTAAAAARAVNKDPELAFLTREMVEGSVRATSIQSDLAKRKAGIQDRIDSGKLEPDAVNRAEETITIIDRLMESNNPIYEAGSKKQTTLYHAVNSLRRTAFELDKRGYQPYQLLEAAGQANWRNPIMEARTAAARMNLAGQVPLRIAGRKEGSTRVVDPVAFLRKEQEARVRYGAAKKKTSLDKAEEMVLFKQDLDHQLRPSRKENGGQPGVGSRYRSNDNVTRRNADVNAAKAIATRLFSATARNRALDSLNSNGGRFTQSEITRLASSGKFSREDVESLQSFNKIMDEIEDKFVFGNKPGDKKFRRVMGDGQLGDIGQTPVEILSRNLDVRVKWDQQGVPHWWDPKNGNYSKFGEGAVLDQAWAAKLNPEFKRSNRKLLWQVEDTYRIEKIKESLGFKKDFGELEFPFEIQGLLWDTKANPEKIAVIQQARDQIASSLERYYKNLDERGKASPLTVGEKSQREIAFFASKAIRDDEFMKSLAKSQGNERGKLDNLLKSESVEAFADEYVYQRTAWILDDNVSVDVRPGAPERLEGNTVIVDWSAYQKQVKENNPDLVDKSYSEDVIGNLSPYRDSIFWTHTRRSVSDPIPVIKENLSKTVRDPGEDLAIRQRDYQLWMNGELSLSVEPFMRQLDITVRAAGAREFFSQVLSTWGMTADDGRLLIFDDETALRSTVSTEFYEAVPLSEIIKQAEYTSATKATTKDGIKFEAKDVDLAGRKVDRNDDASIFNYLNKETVRVKRKVNEDNDLDPNPADQVVAIPKEVWREVNAAVDTPNKFFQAYDTLLNAWRAGMLAAAPRWFLNNFLGNTFFVGMANGLDLKAFGLAKAQKGKGGTSERYTAERGGVEFDADNKLLTRENVDNMVRHSDRQIFSAREQLPFGIEGSTYSAQGQASQRSSFNGASDDLPTETNARFYEAQGGTKVGQRYWKATDSLFRLNQGFEAVMRRAIYVSRGKKALRESGRNVPKFWDRQYDNYQLLQDIVDLPESTKREILKETRNFIGDYGSLTKVERQVMRRVIPFYSWIRVLNTWLFGLPFRSPLRAELLATASQVGAAAFGEDQSILPWWERGRIGWGNVRLRTAGSNPLMTAVEPLRDMATRSTVDPASMVSELGKTYLGSTSPVVGSLMSLAGMNTFGDRKFTSPQNYGGAVTPFGSGNKYYNEATGEIEERSAHPHISDLLLDVLPGTSVVAPMVRQAVAGQRRPYDTSSTMSLVLNELGVGTESVDDLYQPPPRNGRSREPLFGDRTSALMSYLGAPLNRIDPLQERLSWIAQQSRFNQEKIRQGPRIGRESIARRLEGYGG